MRNKELFRGRRKAGRIVGLVLTLALAVSLLSGCGQSKERLTFGTGGKSYSGFYRWFQSEPAVSTGRRFPAWICPVRCNGLCMGRRKSI